MFHTIELPKHTSVYRSYTDVAKREGYWYSINVHDTYGYGSTTGEFRLVKPLKLVDIAHPNFYTILMRIIKDLSKINSNIEKNKALLLFPFGFDDRVFYRDYAKMFGYDAASYNLNPHVHATSLIDFNNRSRLSIHDVDIAFMKFLNAVCGKECDGIVSRVRFPDVIRNGFHTPEIGIFDKSSIEFVKDIPCAGDSETVLRSVKLETPESLKIIDEFNRDMEQFYKSYVPPSYNPYLPPAKLDDVILKQIPFLHTPPNYDNLHHFSCLTLWEA